MKKMTIFILVIVFVLLLASCGPESLSDSKKGFCDSMAKLGGAIETAQGIDAGTTVEQVQDAQKELKGAMDGVRESAGDLKEVQLDKVDDAYDAMMDKIKGVSGKDTLGEAAGTIQEAVTKFAAAYKVINTTVCVGK